MTISKIKQIGLALWLMASLFIGHASACMCSHHDDVTATSGLDCHEQHEAADNVENPESGNAVDEDCCCAVDYPSPYVGARSTTKELNSNDPVADVEQALPEQEFIGAARYAESTSALTPRLSVSNTLKALLPSRAPPRL